MNKKEINAFLEKTAQGLIDLMEQPVSKITVRENKAGVFQVHFQTDRPETLVGFQGKTIESVGLIFQLAVFQKFGPDIKVLADVNDYRQVQEEKINNLALKAAEETKSSGQPVYLPPMSSYKRRLVHLALADNPEVTTVSQGEGRNRYVTVSSGGGGDKSSFGKPKTDLSGKGEEPFSKG